MQTVVICRLVIYILDRDRCRSRTRGSKRSTTLHHRVRGRALRRERRAVRKPCSGLGEGDGAEVSELAGMALDDPIGVLLAKRVRRPADDGV
jgi:hypothetical protein